jgi:hypothetical protein
MRHEWFAVVLADVAVRVEAGLASQIAGELTAVVVLDENDSLALGKDASNFIGVKWNNPPYLEMISYDSLLAGQFFDRFTNHPVGRAPSDKRDGRVLGAEKSGGSDIVDRSLPGTPGTALGEIPLWVFLKRR